MTDAIGIVGLGVVGGILDRFLPSSVTYDKYKGIGSLEEVNSYCNRVYICVPTPCSGGKVDLTAIEENLEGLTRYQTVILRSTVPPGTCSLLQDKYPNLTILYWPEFLREENAFNDFLSPPLKIIGCKPHSKDKALASSLFLEPPFGRGSVLSWEQAELLKLTLNAFLSLKVMFANQVWEVSQNYQEVLDLIQLDPRVGKGHLDVWAGGYRGFDGKCLPKDLDMLLGWARSRGTQLPLLDMVQSLNNELLKERKVDD